MRNIIYIEANIVSISPLFIGDDEENILIDNEKNMAYLPATSIAGAFRAYLNSIGEKDELLFGERESSKMSKVFIKDSFAKILYHDNRDGLKIDGETGTNVHGSKIERTYLGEGLEFSLCFEMHLNSNGDKDLKLMIYKALKGLDKGIIRFGGNKSSGLGIFKLLSAKEMIYNLKDLDDLSKYLKTEENPRKDILKAIEEVNVHDKYVEFLMKGNLSTPLIIRAPKSFRPNEADNTSIKTGSDNYVIPGSSFKGILRARIETISNCFGNKNEAAVLFGQVKGNSKENVLSRIFVKESIIDNSQYLKEIEYNKIKLDKFTSGVKYGSLMQEVPTMGSTEFHVIYRKTGEERFDNYAIGVVLLALRDLGTENIGIGGSGGIGRGRFKANTLSINTGNENIDIDFNNKTISNDEMISKYIESVKNLNSEVMNIG